MAKKKFKTKYLLKNSTDFAPTKAAFFVKAETRKIDDFKGNGLFALEDIPKGTILGVEGGGSQLCRGCPYRMELFRFN